MKSAIKLLSALVFGAAFCSTPAFAADAPAKQLTPQQQKMATCSHEAKEKSLSGAERRTFLSTCLKNASVASATEAAPAKTPATHGTKQSCRAQAKRQHLAGDARKAFIDNCTQEGTEVAAAR